MKTTEEKTADKFLAMDQEIKRLKKLLNKAEVILFYYAPKDVFFPEIEQQSCQFMDKIHNALKEKEILYHPTGHTPAFHRKVKD